MSLQFEFDSADYTGEAGFEAYRALYAVGSDVERGAGPFRARARAVRLDSLILYEREISGVIHTRAARAGKDAFDHFALHLVLAGRLIGGPESRFDEAGPGELIVADTRLPTRTEAADLHLLTVSLPRPALAAAAGGASRLHGARVGPPHTGPLGDLMRSLIRHVPALPSRAHPPLRRALVELVGAALTEAGATARRELRSDLDATQAAVAYIVEHLGDRGLDAARVAEAVGASRPRIYRAFAAHGGVSQFIMMRRLQAVRDAIDAGSTEPLAALAMRYGFTDESHLNRRFAQAFGRPAGAYRRALAAEGAGEAASRRLQSWISTLD